ncbi:uncharacterized protein METZ01_LOCUS336690, partial [marine metagenome]
MGMFESGSSKSIPQNFSMQYASPPMKANGGKQLSNISGMVGLWDFFPDLRLRFL